MTLLQLTYSHAHVACVVVSACALQLTEAGAPAGGRCERDGFRLHEHEAVRSAVQLPGVPLHELRISVLDHVERPDDLPVHADADGFHVLSGAQGLLRPLGLGGGGGGRAAYTFSRRLRLCVAPAAEPLSCPPLPAPQWHTSLLSLPLALGLAGWLPPSVLDLARTRTRRRAVLPSQDNEFW